MNFLWDGLGTTGVVLRLLPTPPLVLAAAMALLPLVATHGDLD